MGIVVSIDSVIVEVTVEVLGENATVGIRVRVSEVTVETVETFGAEVTVIPVVIVVAVTSVIVGYVTPLSVVKTVSVSIGIIVVESIVFVRVVEEPNVRTTTIVVE